MVICFMCDLHLSNVKETHQYKALEWAVADIMKKQPDCILCAGDITCDGNVEVYNAFLQLISRVNIPFYYIPGNSDLRRKVSYERIKNNASDCKNRLKDILVFAVNDCDRTVSDASFELLEDAEDDSIVFMHHPYNSLSMESRTRFGKWRERHKNTRVFFGHLHKSYESGADISLQALDPDKAIGENACITYYDTQTSELRKAYYFSPVPTDIYSYFGVSCYRIEDDIELAIKHRLICLELRPNCLNIDEKKLIKLIEQWRGAGGENLSLHLPEIGYSDGEAVPDERLDRYIALARKLKVNRFTQHVPRVSVRTIKNEPRTLEKISACLAKKLNTIDQEVVIGVENMHMTSKDAPDDSRRFGYLPEECIDFMLALGAVCRHRVGINFDIGHARNNAPYSQKYQISTWLSMIGKYAVGYHIHQVTLENGVFENHTAITEIYGRLISFGSFFRSWSEEQISKAPVVFEMRPEGAYETTLATFDRYKYRIVSDIHSHTYFSNCGRDDPHKLIRTAITNGLSVFGISDHNYGIADRKAEYIRYMRSLKEQYKDEIMLVCGIEIATIPSLFDIKSAAEIKDYDYCLIEHITYPESIVGGDILNFCKSLGILCGIAHTDLFQYCDMYGYDYESFFSNLAEHNIFWEMNVSYDSIHHYREHEYVNAFINDANKINIVKKSGIYVSIGFDSHRLEDYDGYRVHKIYDTLKSNGIRTIDELILGKE